MTEGIGFRVVEETWSGDRSIGFEVVSEHTKSVRYRAAMKERDFDLYVPRPMLPGGKVVPKNICVRLAAPGKGRDGHPGCVDTSETTDEELTLVGAKTNSYLYRSSQSWRAFSVYVPKEVFGEMHPPSTLHASIEPGRRLLAARLARGQRSAAVIGRIGRTLLLLGAHLQIASQRTQRSHHVRR